MLQKALIDFGQSFQYRVIRRQHFALFNTFAAISAPCPVKTNGRL